ncbi:hypothetical protein D9758_006439 [Tetrapyrgos nigripes]|uniref:GATA-type domain-containing protein n=1 Tax=Tetrapyrgos nigripes TaxID=182062 RepID=A0A8H5GKV2_9AGAR|nr:hypothetical protein D9758_006439 [Tetrapyrgos nigripes]
MPSILNLKFKGNKSFVAFSNLGDAEALTKTWKVCTKVAGYLEQGQRLENLSWRLWHLQNLMVDTDNAKSKREFKKLSKCMSDKLDKEKGRAIEELEAPDFKHNPSSNMIRQRAVEKERNREASQNAQPGTIKRMQFTFSIDQPTPVSAQLVKKPDLKPSPEFNKRPRVGARQNAGEHRLDDDNVNTLLDDANDKDPPLTQRGRKSQSSSSSSDSSPSSSSASNKSSSSNTSVDSQSLRFPSLFSDDFGPSALLYPSPTLKNRMNYGEATAPHDNDQDGFSIPRPTIELPLDELLSTVDSPRPWSPSFFSTSHSDSQNRAEDDKDCSLGNNVSFNPNDPNSTFFLPNIPPYHQNDVIMQSISISDDSNNADDHTMTFSDLISTHNANHNSLTTTQPLTLHPASFSNSYNQPDTSDDSSASIDSDDEASEVEMSNATGSPSSSKSQAISGMPTPTPSTAVNTATPTPTPTPTPSASLTASMGRGGRFGKNASIGRGASASVGRSGRGSTPRPHLTVRTSSSVSTRSGVVLGATPTSLNPALLRASKDEDEGVGSSSTATTSSGRGTGGSVTAPVGRTGAGASAMGTGPGGQKAECSNCGATHTPLWRRGLNDELNCNACGLYCKLHKRPRPKTMRNTHGEGRAQTQPRPETVDVMAQCYNCHTTATPLWRKDDEGKTVCNACGLYYKLHGSARPISMKSDVIRKRSRHDARRGGGALAETPSASPGVSRRASPARETSPTLAPDSSTSTTPPQMNYQYPENVEYSSQSSELLNALGQDMGQSNTNDANNQSGSAFYQNMFGFQFPGPYHPDHLAQFVMQDPLPFASAEFDGLDSSMSPRSNKRRRMSTDSASEPPSSAVSFTSFDGYSSATSATSHSQRSSVDYAFSSYPASTPTSSYTPFAPASLSGGGMHVFRGSSNTFWHPPMTLSSLMGGHGNHNNVNNNSPAYHPPMLPPSEDSPMDYLHPPLLPHDDDALFSAYLHPPMSLPEEGQTKGQSQQQGSPKQQGQGSTQGQQQSQGQKGQNQSSGQDYMVY